MVSILLKFARWLEALNRLDRIVLGLCFLSLSVVLDYTTGLLPTFILYVLCIAWSSNYIGGRFATGFALVAAFLRITSPEYLTQDFRVVEYFNIAATFLIVDAAIQYKNRLLDQLYRLLAQLESQSLSDPLTGVSNRRAFIARLEAAIAHTHRYHEPFSLAYIDIDSFKLVNDTAGHAAGDRLLCVIAHTIRATLRGDDMVARLGGDEFGMILTHAPQNLDRYLERVRQALHTELEREAAFQIASFSIGVVHYDGARCGTCDELIHLADHLMYEVKRSGKDGMRMGVFSHSTLHGN